MQDKALTQRMIITAVVFALGLWKIIPPAENLRPGLDISGGVELIFEIDNAGDTSPQLAEQMRTLLKKRVDPLGVYDTAWRVVGQNRISVTMPLAPPENQRLRDAYDAVKLKISEANLTRSRLEEALVMAEPQRTETLKSLAAGSPTREAALLKAAVKQDAYAAAAKVIEDAKVGPDGQPIEQVEDVTMRAARMAVRDADEELQDAKDAALEGNFDVDYFESLLEMDEKSELRTNGLNALRENYPSLRADIDAAIAAFKTWRSGRAYLESPADLIRLLRGSGVLEFRILADNDTSNPTKYDRLREDLEKYGPERSRQTGAEGWFKVDNPAAFFDIDSPKELESLDPRTFRRYVVAKRGKDWFVLGKLGKTDGLLSREKGGPNWKLTGAGVGRDEHGRRSVEFSLDPVGAGFFRELTRRNIGRPLCILVDDIAYSAPNINSEIGGRGQIVGEFSAEKVNYLVSTMQAGSLPGKLKDTPISERTIGSSLGEQNLQSAFRAGVYGLCAVLFIMIVYYGRCGAIANVAMLMNLVLVLAVMSMLGARFNLAAIAGLILGIGMAVDANILIFERMREEKERGGSLRMILKNGYDKAFTTIFDSNVTTLLTCVIMYYVGSEEVRGFGLTLGWGVALNMFTAVFVTRTLFMLLMKFNLLQNFKMMKLVGVPTIDWWSLRRYSLPISAIAVLVGITLLALRGPNQSLDVEFLGGVQAEVQVTKEASPEFTDARVRELLEQQARVIREEGTKLAGVTVAPVPNRAAEFLITVPGLKTDSILAMINEPLEDRGMLERRGLREGSADGQVVAIAKADVTADQIAAVVKELGGTGDASIARAAANLEDASIGSVKQAETSEGGKAWNISTTVTNKRLVQAAIVDAFGKSLQIKPRITYVFEGVGEAPFGIDNRKLERVVPGLPPTFTADVTDYFGGAAIYLKDLSPPASVESLTERFKGMRYQPDFQDYPTRPTRVFGVTDAGRDAGGRQLFSSVVVVVYDQRHLYQDEKGPWTEVAMAEKRLISAALDTEQTLRQVTAFKPQIAAQAVQKAAMALLLGWVMIIGYVWVRFGRARYGIAGVLALVHDVLIALAAIGLSGWIGGTGSIGGLLLIEDFKINMTVVAALLTLIGFSINDTIVTFDRIRELRGRMGQVTVNIINDSVNQTFSRTILTSFTVFVVILIMYVFGGEGIRGFNFTMLVGVITGTYSTVFIAAPLLMLGLGRKVSAASKGQPAFA